MPGELPPQPNHDPIDRGLSRAFSFVALAMGAAVLTGGFLYLRDSSGDPDSEGASTTTTAESPIPAESSSSPPPTVESTTTTLLAPLSFQGRFENLGAPDSSGPMYIPVPDGYERFSILAGFSPETNSAASTDLVVSDESGNQLAGVADIDPLAPQNVQGVLPEDVSTVVIEATDFRDGDDDRLAIGGLEVAVLLTP